jgi:hypothetical protein
MPNRPSTRVKPAAKVSALQAGECRVDFVSILSIFVRGLPVSFARAAAGAAAAR